MISTYGLLRRILSPRSFVSEPQASACRPQPRAALRPAERLYIGALASAAAAVTAFALGRAEGPTTGQLVLTLVLGTLVAVAWLFPLPFAFKTELCLDTTVLVAAVLLLDPALAIVLAAGGTAFAHLVRQKEPAEAIFNTAQVSLQVAGGASVLAAAGWRPAELNADRFGEVATVALAAVAMIAITEMTVAGMVAVQAGMNPVRSWLTATQQTGLFDLAAQLAQVGLGMAAAILVHAAPWSLVLLLLPAAAVHVSLAGAQKERRRAADALRDTEAALAEAERIAHLGSWEWDLTSGQLHWSDETYRILGLSPANNLPSWAAFLQVVHADDRFDVDRNVHEVILQGRSFNIEHRIVRADGLERIVYAQGEVLRGANGEKRRLIGTLQDVTDRKRAEEARDELLASLSHDLKSPLTIIQAQAQLMQRRLHRDPDPTVLDRGLERISATTQAMSMQITELLEFARQEMSSALPASPIDLGVLARERATLYQPATEQHVIVVDSPPAGPVTVGDRRQLARVIDNLLGNAIKYSPNGGDVAVHVTQERDASGSWAVLSVQDHGIGIPAEDLPRIFDSFKRGSNVDRIEGFGVGLAGAKRLIALHGGAIDAESSPSKGTTITVRLPIVQYPRSAAARITSSR